jgi:hypothetical protein
MIKNVINTLTGMIIGMLFMSMFYCQQLGITSGPMYIGWDTAAFTLGGVIAMRLLVWLDPSFAD